MEASQVSNQMTGKSYCIVQQDAGHENVQVKAAFHQIKPARLET